LRANRINQRPTNQRTIAPRILTAYAIRRGSHGYIAFMSEPPWPDYGLSIFLSSANAISFDVRHCP
jgi:hypothetical protein